MDHKVRCKSGVVDVFRGDYRLQELRAICLDVFKQVEVLVVPTLPTIPTRAEVEADSIGWSRRLGTYTNFVNLLGLAALSVPAGFTRRGLPSGITLIGPAGSDSRLCELGKTWQRSLALPLGATDYKLPPATVRAPVEENCYCKRTLSVCPSLARTYALNRCTRRCCKFYAHFTRC